MKKESLEEMVARLEREKAEMLAQHAAEKAALESKVASAPASTAKEIPVEQLRSCKVVIRAEKDKSEVRTFAPGELSTDSVRLLATHPYGNKGLDVRLLDGSKIVITGAGKGIKDGALTLSARDARPSLTLLPAE